MTFNLSSPWRIEIRPARMIVKDKDLYEHLSSLTIGVGSHMKHLLKKAEGFGNKCRWVVFLFYLNNRIVAWAMLLGNFISIFVEEQHRRKGIGSKIIEEAWIYSNMNCPIRPRPLIASTWNESSNSFFEYNKQLCGKM